MPLSSLLLGAAALALATWLAKALKGFIYYRRSFAALPGPPSSLLFGHLEVMGKVLSGKRAPDIGARLLARQYGGIVFLDPWPFRNPMCIITDHSLAERILRVDDLPKADTYRDDWPILGQQSLVTLQGDTEQSRKDWHSLRRKFNPGFKRGTLERNWTQLIAKETVAFVERLREKTRDGQPFPMMDYLIVRGSDLITLSDLDPLSTCRN